MIGRSPRGTEGARFLLAASVLLLMPVSCGRTDNSHAPSGTQTATPTPTALPCASRPGPRARLTFVYMPERQEAVLFGGQDQSNRYLNDTWTWKAGCWTQQSPTHSPPPLEDPAAAFDAARGLVVMYGDYRTDTGPAVGTWTWDGHDWLQSTSPAPLFPAPVAAYDPNNERVILFGESLQGGEPQTWAWGGVDWKQLMPATEPGARQRASMAFDPTTQSLLLFGGLGGNPNSRYLADTWSWNGTNWNQLHPVTSPPPRINSTMVAFAARGRLLLVGGADSAMLADAWFWDGNTWTATESIGPRGSAVAIDTGSQVILFGGWNADRATSDAWSWDGANWAAQ